MVTPLPASGAARPTPLPVDAGRLERWTDFPSAHITPRPVDIWLPPDYAADRPHAVLYMHDGQMLFDARTTWNGKAWHVQRAVMDLMARGLILPTLIVGVWNHQPLRYAEYFPQKALAWAPEAAKADYVAQESQGKSLADAYLRFLVEELKPFVDSRYATLRDARHTQVVGASMGGLISLYALCEYPQVFGGAGGLSTHWVGRAPSAGLERARQAALPLALLTYLQSRLPPAGSHRVWLDRGDDALDSLYAPGLSMAAEVLRDRGYTASQAQVRVFPGTGHDEGAWAQRVGEVLAFLMAPKGK